MSVDTMIGHGTKVFWAEHCRRDAVKRNGQINTPIQQGLMDRMKRADNLMLKRKEINCSFSSDTRRRLGMVLGAMSV
jgi:hypothetical protein